MYEIKKLNPLSVARISAAITLSGFFIWALFASFFILFFDSYGARYFFEFQLDLFNLRPNIYFFILGLFLSGIAGFVSGIISSLIYNLVANLFGGVKMEIEMVAEENE